MKILAVLRASTVKQELDSQKVEMQKFCTIRGFDEIEWIEVKGASARKANNEYLQMLEDIKTTIISKGIKNVAFWSLDRLGRIESYIMLMKEWFTKNQIQVYVNNPSLVLLNEDGTQNAGASIAWSVFASMVAFETEELMHKMRRTKDMNAKNNKFNGGLDVKVGYVINDAHYVVVDDEDEGYKLVQLIFNEYATGKYSTLSLTKELKERGITKPNGKPLDSRYVTKILNDESYIGGRSKDVVTERTYTPIISKDVWNKCKEVATNNRKGDASKQTKNNYLSLKILKCPCCGGNLSANSKHYRCFRAFDKSGVTKEPCINKSAVRIEVIDAILWDIASFYHTSYLIDMNENDKEQYQRELDVITDKINERKRQLEAIPNQKMKIQLGFENGIYTFDEYNNKLYVVNENVKTIESTILSLKAQEAQIKAYIEGDINDDEETNKILDMMEGVFHENDVIRCKNIINQHIDRCVVKNVEDYQLITVYPKHGHEWTIHYKYRQKKGHNIYQMGQDGKLFPNFYSKLKYNNGTIERKWAKLEK